MFYVPRTLSAYPLLLFQMPVLRFLPHPGERGVPDAYVDALLRELARFAPDAPLRPDTVYFGGGTPACSARLRSGGSSVPPARCPGLR